MHLEDTYVFDGRLVRVYALPEREDEDFYGEPTVWIYDPLESVEKDWGTDHRPFPVPVRRLQAA